MGTNTQIIHLIKFIYTNVKHFNEKNKENKNRFLASANTKSTFSLNNSFFQIGILLDKIVVLDV